jgi:hypothetical protein
MKFPLRYDAYTTPENYRLDFQVWDKDLLSKNDFLASKTINAWEAIQGCIIEGRRYALKQSKDSRDQRIELLVECNPTGPAKGKQCKVVVSIECMSKQE